MGPQLGIGLNLGDDVAGERLKQIELGGGRMAVEQSIRLDDRDGRQSAGLDVGRRSGMSARCAPR